MIVKVLSRHSATYKSLIDYILNEDKSKGQKSDVITHNIRSQNREDWHKEFAENESFRLYQRKDSIRLYHEVLSFSANENTEAITKELLADITRKYIELRGANGMYIASPHFDQEHVHIHIMSSGLAFRTGKAFRIALPELQKLKVELQKYHIEKYPALTQSTCKHNANLPYTKHREWQATQRDVRNTIKGTIAEQVRSCYETATSQHTFLERLREAGLHHYERKGLAQGIVLDDGMKFRFTRLGISQEQIKALPEVEQPQKHMTMKTKEKPTDITPTKQYIHEEQHILPLQEPELAEQEDRLAEFYKTYMQMEIQDLQEKLDKVYEEKNNIFAQLNLIMTMVCGTCKPEIPLMS
jgi:hypothetical protein